MTDPGYTKANITYEANAVLKYLSKKSKKPAYEILDNLLREKHPELFDNIDKVFAETMPKYFRKIGC
jgi:hypothetical protein